MTGNIVAENTDLVTTIHVRCPRGKAVKRIRKVLLEVEKGVSLAFNATNLRVGVGCAEVWRINSEQTKEKGKSNSYYYSQQGTLLHHHHAHYKNKIKLIYEFVRLCDTYMVPMA